MILTFVLHLQILSLYRIRIFFLIFCCLILAHAASLSDVNKLVELLNHQLQQARDVEEPVVSPVRALPVAPAQSEMPKQPAVLPDMPMMPTMPETEYYGMMGHEKCTTYIRDLFEDMYRIPAGVDMIGTIIYPPPPKKKKKKKKKRKKK